MSRTAQKLISASGGKAYEIEQSLMFNVGDSSYLSRDYGTGANSYTKWTFSTWIKFDSNNNTGETTSGGSIWTSWDSTSQNDTSYGWIGVYQDKLQVSGWSTTWRTTNRVFRDVGAWYHIVVAVDTNESTADNRIRIYINGVEETSFATKNNPSTNTQLPWNKDQQHRLGAINGSTPYYLGAYLAETQVIDGSQLTPSSFGETDAITGQWIPKKYTGTYSGYSFYLKYVSGALGTDSSGQGTNYTANNLANADVLLDSPTNNFCTLNSIQPFNTTIGVLDQGNLKVTAGTYDGGHYSNLSTTFNVPASGKWYAECRIGISVGSGNVTVFGVTDQDINWSGVANENLTGMDGFFTSLYGDYIKVMDSGTLGTGNTSATATSYILGMALDVDNGYAYFGVDSGSAMVWYKADGSTSGGDPTSGSTGTGGFARTFTTDDTITVSVAKNAPGYANHGSLNILNFGQNGTFSGTETAGGNADGNGRGNFFRSPPSGYLALCSQNLPSVTVKKPTANFDIATYAGNGATAQEISLNFNPDLVWIKSRSDTEHHSLVDRVRGDVAVNSNQSIAEYAVANFDWNTNNTVDVPVYANDYSMNTSGDNYVMWHWKAGGSGSTNNDGAEASTVSVNTTAGFSIMKAEGTGSSTTYGHGLGVVPKVYIVKLTSDTGNWFLQTSALDGGWDYFQLNGTAAPASMTATAPTSSVITGNIASGETAIYYAWAEVEGFSRFGKYIGNGNTDGVFVNCGFTPSYVLFKNHTSGAWWWVHDTGRDPLNLNTLILFPNATTADYTSGSNGVDFLSNGIKLRADNDLNGSGQNVFFMAFAEFPFKYANAR